MICEAVKVGEIVSPGKASYVGGHGQCKFGHKIYRLITAGFEEALEKVVDRLLDMRAHGVDTGFGKDWLDHAPCVRNRDLSDVRLLIVAKT
jgi:hypothetical protein